MCSGAGVQNYECKRVEVSDKHRQGLKSKNILDQEAEN